MSEVKTLKEGYINVSGTKYRIDLTPRLNVDASVEDADNDTKGVAFLSDEASDLNAATGKTAATPKAVKTVKDSLDTLQTSVGNLEDLTTTSKDSVINAINEVKKLASIGGGGEGGSVPETVATTDAPNVYTQPQTFNKNVKLAETAGIVKQATGEESTDLITTVQNQGGKSVARSLINATGAERSVKLELLTDSSTTLAALRLASTDGVNATLTGPEVSAEAKDNELVTAKWVNTKLSGIGGEGGVTVDATDAVKGVVKLSDAVDGTEEAATGVTAATPKAVADVNKIANQAYTVANAVGSKVGNLADLTTEQKASIVGAINELKTNIATGSTDIGNATDTKLGLVKLTDSLTSGDLTAASGNTAASAKAVSDLNTKLAELENQIGQGGGSEGGIDYVFTPSILSPDNKSPSESIKVTISCSPFAAIIESITRSYRQFQISKSNAFTENVVDAKVNADSYTVESPLDATTKYFVRVRDVTNEWKGRTFTTPWSSVIEFTTSEGFKISTPTLTLHGYKDSPTDILTGVRITGSAFTVEGSTDTHSATSWSVAKVSNLGEPVWKEDKSAEHLTEVTIPDGTFEAGVTYEASAIYYGTEVKESSAGKVRFTVSTDTGTVIAPTVTMVEETDKVQETPTFNLTKFECTREGDTQKNLQVIILKKQGSEQIHTDTISGSVASYTMPKGKLKVSTAYVAKFRYEGNKFGNSDWGQIEFTTASEFVSILTPVLTRESGVGKNTFQTLKISATPFLLGNSAKVLTHKSTTWRVVRVHDQVEIMLKNEDTTNLTSLVITNGNLQTNLEYLVECTYHADDGTTSAKATLQFTNADVFTNMGIPTLTLNGCSSDALDHSFVFMSSAIKYLSSVSSGSSANASITKVSYELYRDEAKVWSKDETTDSGYFYCLGNFDGYSLVANTKYTLKYRQYCNTTPDSGSAGWTEWVSLDFTTAGEDALTYPTIKFKVKKAIRFSSIFNWFPSATAKVYRNGQLEATWATNYTTEQALSDTGDIIEIVNTTDKDNYPVLYFSNTLNGTSSNTYGANLLSIEAPLPKGRKASMGALHTSYKGQFANCTELLQVCDNLYKYNTHITDFSYAFYNCAKLASLPDNTFANCNYVTSYEYCLSKAGITKIQRGLFVSKESCNLQYLANAAPALETVESGAFASVTNINNLYCALYQASALTTVQAGAFGDAYYVTNLGYLFSATALKRLEAGVLDKMQAVTSIVNLCFNCKELTTVDAGVFDSLLNVTSISSVFSSCAKLAALPNNLLKNNVNATNCASFCADAVALTSVPNSLFANLPKLTTVASAFKGCTALESFGDNLVEGTAVTTLESLFEGCTSLTTLGSNLIIESCTTLNNLFKGCSAITAVDKDYFTLGTKVTNISYLFSGCQSLNNIDEYLFKAMTKVTNATGVFQTCTALTQIPELLFSTMTALTTLDYAFEQCTSLTSISGSLLTNNTAVTTVKYMFQGCTKLNDIGLYLFKYNTNIMYFGSCFKGCNNLTVVVHIGSTYNASGTSGSTYTSYFAADTAAKGIVYCYNGASSYYRGWAFNSDSTANVSVQTMPS